MGTSHRLPCPPFPHASARPSPRRPPSFVSCLQEIRSKLHGAGMYVPAQRPFRLVSHALCPVLLSTRLCTCRTPPPPFLFLLNTCFFILWAFRDRTPRVTNRRLFVYFKAVRAQLQEELLSLRSYVLRSEQTVQGTDRVFVGCDDHGDTETRPPPRCRAVPWGAGNPRINYM